MGARAWEHVFELVHEVESKTGAAIANSSQAQDAPKTADK